MWQPPHAPLSTGATARPFFTFVLIPSILIFLEHRKKEKEKKNKKKLLNQILLQKEIEDEVEREIQIEEESKVIEEQKK